MSIKFVEDYRRADGAETDRGDADTIQAAIDDLNDGDTLVFNKKAEVEGVVTNDPGTYALDEPVYFTSYKSATNKGVTKSSITVEGNGCTIVGSDVFNRDYGKPKEDEPQKNNRNALFYISDKAQKGLMHSTIKNFKFTWCESGSSYSSISHAARSMAIGVISCKDSKYCQFTTIENCEFNGFGIGIYICGEEDIVKLCKFTYCNKGVFSDGAKHSSFENNYFTQTQEVGLHLTNSYDSIARNNSFYKCVPFSLFCDGPSQDSGDAKSLDVTIADNKICGSYSDMVNEIGIKLQGGQNVLITGNHICGISRMDSNTAGDPNFGYSHGFGIFVSGNTDASNGATYKSKRGIISNNYITSCYGDGIRINIATEFSVTGNSIFNMENRGKSENKRGINVGKNTNNISVENNNIYYYGDRAIRNYCFYFTSVQNNHLFNSSIESMRIISDASYNIPVFTLPDLAIPFVEGEIFHLKIHEGYTAPVVSVIYYDGETCMVSEDISDNEHTAYINTVIPTAAAGKYAVLKYIINGNEKRFIYNGYTDL